MAEVTATHPADHYVQRLNLGVDPFISDFRSDYFYTGGMRRQLLDQVTHFSRFGDQVVLLTGSTGSGTSTLLSTMISQLQPVMDCCVINGEFIMSPERVLESLAEQLQLDTSHNIADFLAVLLHTAINDEDAEPVLIAVDQAHFLALESFELLRHLFEEAKGVVHLLLVGEYQIEQLSKLSGFDNDQIKSLELEPLTTGESGDYLLGLLQSVGYAGEQPLSADQLVVLHEQSGGNIAEINQLVPALLGVDCESASRRLGLTFPTVHIVAVGILGGALILSYLYQGKGYDQITPIAEQPAAVERRLSLNDKALATSKSPKPLKLQRVGQAVERKPPVSLSIEASVLSKQQSSEASVEQDDIQRAVDVPSEQMIAVAELVADVAAPEKKSVDSPTKVESLKTVANLESAKSQESLPTLPYPQQSVQKALSAGQVKASLSTATSAVTVVPVGKKISVRERRLINLPASSYMLQLLGTVSEQRARDFVKEYVGRLSVTYFESRLKGKPWFMVLVGPYDNKAAAMAGAKVLPERLQKQKPWARSVASIQKDIGANN